MAKKTDGVTAAPENQQAAKKKRKVSPIHVENLRAQEHAGAPQTWDKIEECGTAKQAVQIIRERITEGDTMRYIRVLGVLRKKVIKRESLEAV